MLSRAAQRRSRVGRANIQISAAFDQLHLPWLCPAQLRWLASSSRGSPSQPLDAIRIKEPRSVATRSVSRSLATVQIIPRQDTAVYLSSPPNRTSSAHTPARTSEFQSFDPSDLIVFSGQSIASPPPFVKKTKGIGGDSTELHQNLHACLSVGRFERAAAIVRRLAELFNPSAPELLEAHNVYLQSLTQSLAAGRLEQTDGFKRIRYWFECAMRGKGVLPNGTTMAIMCRAAIIALTNEAQVRTVRRYLHVADDLGLVEETLASGELEDQDWERLTEICNEVFPQENVANVQQGFVSSTVKALDSTAKALPDWMTVRPMEQKGMGLTSLKKSLSSIYDHAAALSEQDLEGMTEEELEHIRLEQRQIRLEEDVVDSALARWREEHENMLKMDLSATSLYGKSLEALLWQWQQDLEHAIRAELEEVKKALAEKSAMGGSRLEYGPYLELGNAEKMAAVTILSTIHLIVTSPSEGVKVGFLASRIGGYCEREVSHLGSSANSGAVRRRLLEQQKKSLYRAHARHAGQETEGVLDTASRSVPRAEMKNIQFRPERHATWPTSVRVQIGAVLLSKLIDVAKIPLQKPYDSEATTLAPAFAHGMEHSKGRQVGMVRAQKHLIKKLKKEPLKSTLGLHGHMPMLVQPKLWVDFREGCYYRYPPRVMRSKDDDHTQEMYCRAAIEKGDLKQVLTGLDVLGKTAWRINNDVLKVMLEAWNSGEAIADLPPAKPDIPMPQEPDASLGPAARKQWKTDVLIRENKLGGLHSNRCFLNLQLEVARAYANETFYYPHNIDFRGRAYPIPPILNHMGADNARGLLRFGKGKPLGATGLRWLKISLSNLFGFDKASLDEREQFTMDHMEDVFDSANNPLGGKKWWLQAEDPWQCLATCFELKAALESPDPAQFVSHLPVAQDGSCNGLQHYAALGGDSFGAAAVNLEPGERPADVYSGVAKLVEKAIKEDADAGHAMAKVLVNKITRKLVKQTVMTNVYGVTFVGARAQVHKQLDVIMPNLSESEIPNWFLSAYIAKKVFKALATMFEGAHNIQYWLGECADSITRALTPEQIRMHIDQKKGKPIAMNPYVNSTVWKFWAKKNAIHSDIKPTDFRTSVIWTTPLKLPVVQPYRAAKTKDIQTALQSVSFREPRPYDPVNRRRQLQAFPPNFVHSLDATHMLLSALKCDEAGLTFAAVHDSFWTHAADVPVMSSILRDAFVDMHSDDIIGRLASEFQARYKGSLQLASVYSRSPLGRKLLAFRASRKEKGMQWQGSRVESKVLQHELLEEWERQNLLASEDPEERTKGQAMVTPGTLFEAAHDKSEFQVPKKLDDSSLVLTDPQDAEEADMDEHDVDAGEESAGNFLGKLARRAGRIESERKILVWAPIRFPELPKKGDFDVKRLKDSAYFFS